MTNRWADTYQQDGTLENLIYNDSGKNIKYFFYPKTSPFKGPRLYLVNDKKKLELDGKFYSNEKKIDGSHQSLNYSIQYNSDSPEYFTIHITIKNAGSKELKIDQLGLRLGIDCYMESFPRWNDQLFPTHLRCEKTHFLSYLKSPGGRILGMFSPDPIVSWSLDYNECSYGAFSHFGHRINSINLELLHNGRQPERHPETKHAISPNEVLDWQIFLTPLKNLSEFPVKGAILCNAPVIGIPSTDLTPGNIGEVIVYGEDILKVTLLDEDKTVLAMRNQSKGNQKTVYSFVSPEKPGYLFLNVKNIHGKISEAIIYVRDKWSWYLKSARETIRNKPQKASTHAESWLGFFSAFAARKYFPDKPIDMDLEKHFFKVASKMFNLEKGIPLLDPGRIQNTGGMISLLVAHYKCSGRIESLREASRLADWMATRQDMDGSFRGGSLPDNNDEEGTSGEGQISSLDTWIHYTCVAYQAKSILELALMEKKLRETDGEWEKGWHMHFSMAMRAVQDLKKRMDNIGTEGELTFEDGMIACSALQMGMMALCIENQQEKTALTEAAKIMLNKHSCLVQQLVPDARMRGCTIRFWEAQYDINAAANFITSPHGWTAWKSYAYWYIYLLTGEIEYLEQTMDSIFSSMQLVSLKDGNLRWAFQVDPHVSAKFFQEDLENPSKGKMVPLVTGECYHEMISSWWRTPQDSICIGHQKMIVPESSQGKNWTHLGGCCDNDVHEHFKCLEETMLTRAYVYLKGNTKSGWNAAVQFNKMAISITPNEEIVNSVHFNIDTDCDACIKFYTGDVVVHLKQGFYWVYSDGFVTNDPFRS